MSEFDTSVARGLMDGTFAESRCREEVLKMKEAYDKVRGKGET